MSTEYAYQPLLPAMAAVTGALTNWPPSRSLHFVLAFAYCCGPVTLFWLAWDWSESLALSLFAAFVFLAHFARRNADTRTAHGFGRALGRAASQQYRFLGEAPHNVALAMLPLAYLFLHRAIVRGGAWNMVLAGALSGAVALTNAFGAFGVALGAIAMVLALERGVRTTLIIGVCSYLWISPWLPPSLILWIRRTAWSAEGFFQADLRAKLAIPAAILTFGLIWFLTRRLKSSFERFVCLFSIWMCAIPLGYFWFHHLTIVPQSSRYQLELEMALCLLFGCMFNWVWRHAPVAGRIALAVIFAAIGLRQAANFREFASVLVHPIRHHENHRIQSRYLDQHQSPRPAYDAFRRSRIHFQPLLRQSTDECRPRTHAPTGCSASPFTPSIRA